MGVKHPGGHHRDGSKLPTDGKQTITIRSSDYQKLREYSEWEGMKLVDAITFIFDHFFFRQRVRRARYNDED